jgi:Amt family ammonium transporter
MNGNWVMPFKQLLGVVTIGPWSFVMTYGLLFVIDKIPGMKIRLNPEAEELGSDREYLQPAALVPDRS